MASSNSSALANDRHLRKRLAARLRQQRCRARKREAKMAQNQDSRRAYSQIVRGPVAGYRNPARLLQQQQFPNHSASPFVMFPRRSLAFSSPPAPQGVWQPPSSLQRGMLFARTNQPGGGIVKPPLPQTTLTSPLVVKHLTPSGTTKHAPQSQIPRVSPGGAEERVKSPALGRQEETAIHAMLSLHRRTDSGSSLEEQESSTPPSGQWISV